MVLSTPVLREGVLRGYASWRTPFAEAAALWQGPLKELLARSAD